MFMMKSKVISRPSVANDDLVQCVDQKFVKDNFTISELSCFHKFQALFPTR
jgi:hypothetical protein